MVICPKCNEIIEYLLIPATAMGNCIMNDDGTITYPDDEWEFEGEYLCPDCNQVIADSFDEAQDFMKNTDKLKKVVEEKIKNG